MRQVLNIKSLAEWFKEPENKTISRFVLLFFGNIDVIYRQISDYGQK